MAACTPHLNGTCSSSSDCQSGETCSADHLCLRASASNPGGASDAGDAGNTTGNADAGDAGSTTTAVAANTITAPAANAFVPRVFPVAATATTDSAAITDVTFELTTADATDAGLGTIVTTGGSGTFNVSDVTFNGAAVLHAVAHRSGAADIVAAPVAVQVDQTAPSLAATWTSSTWYARAGSISVPATASDTGSGVASAHLTVEGGGTYAGSIASGAVTFQVPAAELADAGTVATRAFSLVATDVAGNAFIIPADAGLSFNVDDVPPTVAPVPETAWHNAAFNLAANISDQGSGVASASAVFATGTSVAGTAGAGTAWTFAVDVPTAFPAYEGAISYQIVSADVVGNGADAGGVLQIDTVLPTITQLSVDSLYDGVDSTSQGWFAGPTVAPTAGPVVLSAVVSDTNLVTSGPGAPAAVVGANRYTGTLGANGRWSFSIPRSVGQNATAPVTVTLDAQDLAGNHPSSPPSLGLQFDDTAASVFTPSIAADATWYARSASVNAVVGVTLPALPRSGIASVVLKVTGQTDVTCSSTGAAAYSCTLPSTYAPAATESELVFSVVATSNVKVASNGSGSRLFDDLPPVISTANGVPYPAAGTSALAWGHDGLHFTLGDNTTLYTFTAYDCGAGVSALASSISFSPAPSSRSASISKSASTHTCGNGNIAAVYTFTASANLATTAAGTFAALDNTLTLTASVGDAASGQTHTTTAQKGVGVTRRFWSAAPGGVLSQIALGPRLFAAGSGGLYSYDLATGSQTIWLTTTAHLEGIAPNAGTPAVIYDTGGSAILAGNATTGSANYGTCPMKGTYSQGPFALSGASTAVGASTSIATVTGCNCSAANPAPSCTSLGDTCNSILCYNDGGAGCTPASFSSYTNTLTLSGTSVTCPLGGSVPGSTCNGVPSPLGGVSYVVSSTAGLYLGADGTAQWVLMNSSGSVLGTRGQPLASGHGWALIDGSTPAIAYLPDVAGGGIDAVQIGGGGFGSRLYNLSPPFPATVTDMALSSGGILYVLSGNTVYAIYTDSTGGQASQAAAWPSQCHDPCRSSIAGFSCPY